MQLLTKIYKQISDDENTALTQPFNCQDLEKWIKQIANGKSPGVDGLPAEFYKQFLTLLLMTFCSSSPNFYFPAECPQANAPV